MVLVSPGTYVGNFTFQGKAITVASTDGPSVTILDANNVSSGPIFQNGEGPQSVLRGFTITNGVSAFEGSGVNIQSASPTIENNIITGNHGCDGIGITADNSSAIIRNNIVTNNTPNTFTGCTGVGGGGIKISGPGNAQILNNTITGNQVVGNGGGIELFSTTLVTITANTIQNNSSYRGGGISIEGGSQATIVNNLITANTSLFVGSGIYLINSQGDQDIFVNNTIAFNVFSQGSQSQAPVWINENDAGTQFVNNVIVDGTGSGAVACGGVLGVGASFTSNDILSTQPTTPPQTAPPFIGCSDVTGTSGNISVDPQFMNPAGNDFHLQSTSPVIDAGSNSAPNLPDKDLDGNGRIGPGNVSTCVGIVDMGAYEFTLTSSGTGFLPSISDFGTVVIGTSSSPQTVNAFVQGCAQIASVTTTGDFSQTNTCGHALSSSSSCTIQVTFTPIAGGQRTGSLNIDFGLSASAVSTNLSGTGLVVSPSASPTSLTFGNQVIFSNSAAQTVTVFGGGVTTSLQITSVSIIGDYTQTNSCVGLPIAAPSCLVNVSFAPISVGTRPGTMVINTNQGSFTIALSGAGIAPIALLSPSSLDFGNQLVNTTSNPQVVILSNTGGAPLLISPISTSGDFAETDDCPASLGSGASCAINVTFTPVASGTRTGTIMLNTNSFGGTPTFNLTGTGLATLITASPGSLSFPLAAINTTSPAQTLTLTNSGSVAVTIAGISIGGDYAQTNTCGASLDAGASCTFSITFTPSIAGADNDTLTISGNFGSPVVVALNGSGQSQEAFGTISPAFLVFPNQAVETTSPAQTLTYTNTGAVPVSINLVEIVFGPFAQTNDCPASLAPGSSCTINVTFTPPDTTGQVGVLNVDGSGGTAVAILTGSSLPQLVSPTTLNFGHQPINSVSPIQTITFTNSTNSPISISGWSYSLPFNVVNHCIGTIPVGASCTFDATFAPTAHGSSVSTVEITGSFAGSPAVLPIVGTATGIGGSLSPASLSFATQAVGTTSVAQTVSLTNSGAVALNISGIQIAGDFAQTNNCAATLPPGASCTINTTFTPTDVGARTGTLSVSSNATVAIPPVALSGTGAAPAVGVFSPQSLTFGSVNLGAQSAVQTVALSNTGSGTLSVGLTLTGPFSQTNNCGSTLSPGSNCSINVVFAPTVAGTTTGSLTLSGNSTPAPSPVALSGTGTAPTATFSSTSLSFAGQLIGSSSSPQTLSLTNTGTSTLTISSLAISSIGASDFTQNNNCGSSLAAGSSCTINVIFAPLARGARSAALSLASNSIPVAPAISLSGNGQAVLATASPASLTLAAAALNTTSAAQAITFTNSGDTTATITAVSITGDFAQTNSCGTSLAVGASCSVNVTFTPTARGSRTGTVTLQGNFTSPAPVVNLSGTGQAFLASLTPAAFDFGNEPVNTTSNPQPFTYTNTGDLALTISGVAVTPDFSQTNNCPATLAVNASCTINATFVPRSAGAQTASLAVTASVNSSSTVTGTGVVPLATLSPSSLNFGNQRGGAASAPQLVTVTNTGAFPFFVNQLSSSGPYQATNNCSGLVAVGASCTVSVVFAPSSAQSGPFAGSLTIGGDFTATPASVSLSGTATTSIATLSPTVLTFANQNVGTSSAAQTLALANTGTGAINLSGIQATGDFSQTNNCGTSVPAAFSCTITVTFTPTAHGARSGTITVSGDFTGAAPSATLSGSGTIPTASWSPASLSFTNQPVGSSSASQAVTLTSTGDGPLSIATIAPSGDFAQSNNCGSTLASGASCTIAVTFAPAATGARSGALSLTSNSSVAVNSITLSGTGVAPDASLSASMLTFPAQLIFTSSQQSVTLTNSGSAQLNLGSISASGDFSQTNNCSASALAPGASCTITVTFTPSASGTRSGTLTITDNAISGGTQTVSLSGTCVAPAAVLSPTSLSFANQLVNSSSASQTATLNNPGTATLTINSISVTGDYSQTNNCGSSLAAGASCSINVTFTPTARGARNNAIVVSTTAVGGNNLQVTLTGSGIGPVATLSSTALTFAAQLVNTTSAQQAVTLTNSGDAALHLPGISVSGDFAQTNNCGSTVAAGASCTVDVTFTPTTTGTRSGTLTISSDAINGGAQLITVTGTGIAPVAMFSPGSLTFANQLVNSSSTSQSVALSNTGTATLAINNINVSGDFSQVNNCGSGLLAGNSCTVAITFTPTATGNRSGSLTLSSNSSNTVSPVSVSGTGVAPAAALLPASLSFANQVVTSSSASQGVTLSNNGTAALTISGISATGDFNQTNNCGVSLAAGGNCTINVTFTPTAAGTRSGSLIIADNSLGGSPQTATLSGTGVDFSLSASPSSATLNAGQSAHYSVKVTPLGGNVGSSVSLSCSGLPALSECSFAPAAPAPGTAPVTSTLTLTTTSRHSHSGTPAGSYMITISGASGSRVQTVTVQLIVN